MKSLLIHFFDIQLQHQQQIFSLIFFWKLVMNFQQVCSGRPYVFFILFFFNLHYIMFIFMLFVYSLIDMFLFFNYID